MCNKKFPLPPVVASGEQGLAGCGSLSPETAFVKPVQDENFEKYRISIFNGYHLQKYAQQLVRELFPLKQNINFCKCGVVSFTPTVQLFRYPEIRRAAYNGVVTCANSFLCPVCAPRIMGRRSSEIKMAVHQWLAESPENTCYLLTLTFRHSLQDPLNHMLNCMKKSLKSFWSDCSVKNMFSSAEKVGRITALEINFSLSSGWHPHEHILVFCKKYDFNIFRLNELWKSALKKSKLSGVSGIALDLVEARSCDKYLQKISAEMALSNCKHGRGSGSFSPFQLLAAFSDGQDWAGNRFKELFKTCLTMHLHPLQWSAGLKSRFGIGEVSDSDIVENKTEPFILWSMIPRESYNQLSFFDRAFLRICAASGDKNLFVSYYCRCRARAGAGGKK